MIPHQRNPVRRPFVMVKKTGRRNHGAHFLILWSFCLFAFLMPLETVDPFGFAAVFSITKIAGYLFTFLCLFQPRLCFASPPRAFWWFVTYIVAYTFVGIFYSSGYEVGLVTHLATLGQNILLFWICYNLMRDDKFVTRGLLSFSMGCVLLSFLMQAGIGQTALETSSGTRISGLKEDINVFAFIMSLGLLSLMGLMMGRIKVKAKRALLLIPLFLLMLYQIIKTGSRGGMLCFGIGILCLLYRKAGWRSRLLVFLVAGVILAGGVREILRSETTVTRWQSTMERGEVAGRDTIIKESFFMFLEKPIFGWGPINHLYVLGDRTKSVYKTRDTHCDLLWALTSTGLAGGIPFAIGVGLCLWGAWRGRETTQGYLPFALLVAVVTMSMSLTIEFRKVTWMLLAYAAASRTFVEPVSTRVVQLRKRWL